MLTASGDVIVASPQPGTLEPLQQLAPHGIGHGHRRVGQAEQERLQGHVQEGEDQAGQTALDPLALLGFAQGQGLVDRFDQGGAVAAWEDEQGPQLQAWFHPLAVTHHLLLGTAQGGEFPVGRGLAGDQIGHAHQQLQRQQQQQPQADRGGPVAGAQQPRPELIVFGIAAGADQEQAGSQQGQDRLVDQGLDRGQ